MHILITLGINTARLLLCIHFGPLASILMHAHISFLLTYYVDVFTE